MTTILEEARALLPTLRAIKADLHRHPELSFAETRTTRVIRETLLELDLEPVALDLETATVALLRGAFPGPTVALRADIDAIAQQESTDNGLISETPGVMHGCGHDFHTACLLGAAQLLAARRGTLHGNVAFLFQPAEEITQGAAAMVRCGLWEALPEKPACLFAQHTRPELPCGQIGIVPGPIMAENPILKSRSTGSPVTAARRTAVWM